MIRAEIEIGNDEKHRLKYIKDFPFGPDKVYVDGQLFKERKFTYIPRVSFEVGEKEKHQVTVHFGYREWGKMRPRFVVDGQTLFPTDYDGIPSWSWYFMGATSAIAIISGGGAAPYLFGFGGALLCFNVVQNKKYSSAKKKLICTGITIAAWVLFLSFNTWFLEKMKKM